MTDTYQYEIAAVLTQKFQIPTILTLQQLYHRYAYIIHAYVQVARKSKFLTATSANKETVHHRTRNKSIIGHGLLARRRQLCEDRDESSHDSITDANRSNTNQNEKTS